jgi:hypothetical protein
MGVRYQVAKPLWPVSLPGIARCYATPLSGSDCHRDVRGVYFFGSLFCTQRPVRRRAVRLIASWRHCRGQAGHGGKKIGCRSLGRGVWCRLAPRTCSWGSVPPAKSEVASPPGSIDTDTNSKNITYGPCHTSCLYNGVAVITGRSPRLSRGGWGEQAPGALRLPGA